MQRSIKITGKSGSTLKKAKEAHSTLLLSIALSAFLPHLSHSSDSYFANVCQWTEKFA
jgi:hypothetical protein